MIQRIFISFLLISTIALAQNVPGNSISVRQSGNLEGRHGLDLNIGIYDNTNISSITSIIGVNTSVLTNSSVGFMGSIGYQYWFKKYLSFRIGAGALVTDVSTKTTAGTEAYDAANETIVGMGKFGDYWDLIVLAIVITVVISLLLVVFSLRKVS